MIEAKKAECDATDASLEVAIKRHDTEVSVTSVVLNTHNSTNEKAITEKELAQKQTLLKLSSVRSRINKLKRAVKFHHDLVHPAPPVVEKQQRWAVVPEEMIDGWYLPVPNDYLMLRIAVAIAQTGDASVNDILEGEDCTELDSHTNMCVLEKNCHLLVELSSNQF